MPKINRVIIETAVVLMGLLLAYSSVHAQELDAVKSLYALFSKSAIVGDENK